MHCQSFPVESLSLHSTTSEARHSQLDQTSPSSECSCCNMVNIYVDSAISQSLHVNALSGFHPFPDALVAKQCSSVLAASSVLGCALNSACRSARRFAPQSDRCVTACACPLYFRTYSSSSLGARDINSTPARSRPYPIRTAFKKSPASVLCASAEQPESSLSGRRE